MKRWPIPRAKKRRKLHRKGNILILSAFSMVLCVAFLAFAVDFGYVCLVRTEAQACADAAALATAWDLVGEDRLRGDLDTTYTRARNTGSEFAALNSVGVSLPTLQPNYGNADVNGDIVLGRLENPSNMNETLSISDPTNFNSAIVRVRCTAARNQQSPLFFARVLGFDQFDMEAEAVATFDDNVVGFRVTENDPNASLMPFTVDRDDWLATLYGGAGTDNWTYDESTGTVSPGPDGIPEMSMFPISVNGNGNNTGAGNWGSIDIGNNNNSLPDLERQIREGPNAADFEPYNGTLELDPATGTLDLNGDTGISAGMKDAIADVVGLPRTIPLYESVSGVGNNTWFEIVGFVGMRIVDFSFQGNNKFILIQPSYVFDPTAITGANVGESYFVGKPVHLVR